MGRHIHLPIFFVNRCLTWWVVGGGSFFVRKYRYYNTELSDSNLDYGV